MLINLILYHIYDDEWKEWRERLCNTLPRYDCNSAAPEQPDPTSHLATLLARVWDLMKSSLTKLSTVYSFPYPIQNIKAAVQARGKVTEKEQKKIKYAEIKILWEYLSFKIWKPDTNFDQRSIKFKWLAERLQCFMQVIW